MKRKILLLILTLGFLGRISAQQTKFEPQMLDNGFIQMPSPHHYVFKFKPTKKFAETHNRFEDKTTPTTLQSETSQNTYQVNIVLDYDNNSQDVSKIVFLTRMQKL